MGTSLGLNRRPMIVLTEPRSRPRMIVSEEDREEN
jgi:hypothetical protein